jgi:phosphoglycolate phosphatase-like HAD superfamily hydrolase
MVPTLVLFDLDGTLVDTAGAGRRGLERAFEEVFGVRDMAGASSRVRFDGKTDPRILSELARAAGIEESAFEGQKSRLIDAYLKGLSQDLSRPDARRRVLPGVVELLENLDRREGVYLGLLTGNLENGARLKLGAFGLNRFFPDGGFSSDSPDRAVIARIAHSRATLRAGHRFPPSHTHVVGDTELDVACARANGFRAIAVASGWVPREKLIAARPDVLLDSFEALSEVCSALGLNGTPSG